MLLLNTGEYIAIASLNRQWRQQKFEKWKMKYNFAVRFILFVIIFDA